MLSHRIIILWLSQWRLLNIVDQQKSALVIAPTSAGKSFISYYVIEKVIEMNKRIERDADRGVVVVVLPTIALVNQVWCGARQRLFCCLPLCPQRV